MHQTLPTNTKKIFLIFGGRKNAYEIWAIKQRESLRKPNTCCIWYDCSTSFLFGRRIDATIKQGNLRVNTKNIIITIDAHGNNNDNNTISFLDQSYLVTVDEMVSIIKRVLCNLQPTANIKQFKITLEFQVCYALNPIRKPLQSFAGQTYFGLLTCMCMHPGKYHIQVLASDALYYIFDEGKMRLVSVNTQAEAFANKFVKYATIHEDLGTMRSKKRKDYYISRAKAKALECPSPMYYIGYIPIGHKTIQPLIINLFNGKFKLIGYALQWSNISKKMCINPLRQKIARLKPFPIGDITRSVYLQFPHLLKIK